MDDDAEVRRSLSVLLRALQFRPMLWKDGRAFLQRLPEVPSGCVLLDLRMPGVDGLAFQKQLGAISESFPIVMISGHADTAKAAQSLRGGAFAFLSKPFTRHDLCDAVLNAFSWMNDVHARFRMGEVARQKFAKLDERESALLRIFANGQSEQTGSYLLNLTMDEVDLCRENIFKKFEVDRMENAVRIFFEGNVVFSEEDYSRDPRLDSMPCSYN